MPPVALVSDTTHYLPAELLARHDIALVSLYVTDAGGGLRREADIDDLGGYYDALRAGTGLPTTSQPSIGDFLAVYEPLLEAGRDIVSVHLAGGISGTVDSARQAAEAALERFPDRRIEVRDSGSACGGYGAILLAGAAAAEGGADVEAVAARVEQAIASARIWFAVDTLEFLRRGGRIGTAQAWLGGALKVKPILTVRGEILPVERVRTSSRAFARMVEFMTTLSEEGATAWMIQHIQAPEEAERLAEAGRAHFGTEPRVISEIGPVIGAHVGPGLLGVGGVPPALLEA